MTNAQIFERNLIGLLPDILPPIPWSSIINSLLGGFFGAIGAIVPLIIIILVVFYRTRSRFIKYGVPLEQKNLERQEKLLEKHKENFNTIEDHKRKVEQGGSQLNDELFEMWLDIKQKTFDTETEIIKINAWIEKISNASFFDWVGYHIRKTYLIDYFKK